MFFRFPFTTTLLYCLHPLSIVSISPSSVDSSLLDTGYKPPNYPALLLTYAWAFFIVLTFISHAPYLATVYAATVNLSPCGCAMSPPLYLPCLPNYAKGYTLSVGCFSPPTLTTPSLSSTLSNVISTTTIHPINSHAWCFLKLKSIYDNSSFTVLSIFSENASVRLIGLFSSSSFTLEALHATPLKAIPSFSRLAILRWIIDSEPDVHFRSTATLH